MTPKTRPKAKRKGKLKGESTSRQPVQKKFCDGRRNSIWRSEPTPRKQRSTVEESIPSSLGPSTTVYESQEASVAS